MPDFSSIFDRHNVFVFIENSVLLFKNNTPSSLIFNYCVQNVLFREENVYQAFTQNSVSFNPK